MNVRGILLPAVLAALPLCSQSLQLRIEQGAGARAGALAVELESPAGKEPVALQWEFSIPAGIQIEPGQITAGTSASEAQKSIRCAIQVNYRGGKNQFCRCILAGGIRTIPNGALASLKYTAARRTRAGRYEIELKKALAVTRENQKAPIKDSQVQISIQKQ